MIYRLIFPKQLFFVFLISLFTLHSASVSALPPAAHIYNPGGAAGLKVEVEQATTENVSCSPVEYKVKIINNTNNPEPVKFSISCSANTTISLGSGSFSITPAGSNAYHISSIANIAAQGQATFSYFQNPSCNLVPTSNIGTPVTIINTIDFVRQTTQSFTYNLSNIATNTNADENALTFSNNVNYYNFTMLTNGVVSVINGSASGNTGIAEYILDNIGGGLFDGYLKLAITNNCGTTIDLVEANSNPMDNPIVVTATPPSGTEYVLFTTTSLTPAPFPVGSLEPGTKVSVRIKNTAINCFSSACGYDMTLVAGCSPTNFCGTPVVNKVSYYNLALADAPKIYRLAPTPGLYVNQGYGCPDPAPWDKSCFGETLNWEYAVIVPSHNQDITGLTLRLSRAFGNQYVNILKNSISYRILAPGTSPATTTYTPATNAGNFAISDIPATGFYSTGMPSCNADNQMAGEIEYLIGNLCKTCTLYVNFSTMRCCPDNAAPKDEIYSNMWRLGGTYNNECSGDPVAPILYGSNSTSTWFGLKPSDDVSGTATFINPYNAYDGAPKNSLKVDMEKRVWPTNILGGFGSDDVRHSACGDPYRVVVVNNTFMGHDPALSDYNMDFMTTGMQFLPNSCMKTGTGAKGQIIIETQYDDDLRLATNNNITLANGNNSITRVATIVSPTVSRAVFEVADIAQAFLGRTNMTTAEFKQIMIGSTTSFDIVYCCSANTPTPHLAVVMFLGLPCGTGTCKMPLGMEDGVLQARCPGCVTPGAVVSNARFVRHPESYGFEDNNDNGLANRTGNFLTKIDDDYIANHPDVNLSASVSGDRLVDITDGWYREGGGTGGFTFANWRSRWPSSAATDNLYLEYNFTQAVSGGNPIRYPGNINISNPRIRYNNSTTLVDMDILSSASITDGYALLHVSIADLQAQLSGVTHFTPGDVFQITADVEICGNPITTLELENTHRMYFTVAPVHIPGTLATASANPSVSLKEIHEATEIAVGTYTGDMLDMLDPEEAPISTALFVCEGRSAKHTRYPVQSFYNETWTNGNACDKFVTIIAGSYIGQTGPGRLNLFPFEYKPVPGFDVSSAANFAKGPQITASNGLPDLLYFSASTGTSPNIDPLTFSAEWMRTELRYRDHLQLLNRSISSIPATSVATGAANGAQQFSADVAANADYEPAYESSFTYQVNTNIQPQQVTGQLPSPTLLVGDEFFRQEVRLRALTVCTGLGPKAENVNLATHTSVNAAIPEILGSSCSLALPAPAQIIDDATVVPNVTITVPHFSVAGLNPTFKGNILTYTFTIGENWGGIVDFTYFIISRTNLENLIPDMPNVSGHFVGINEVVLVNNVPVVTAINPVVGTNIYQVNGALSNISRTYQVVYSMDDCRLFDNGVDLYPKTVTLPGRFIGNCTPLTQAELISIETTGTTASLCKPSNPQLSNPLSKIFNATIPAPKIPGEVPITFDVAKGCTTNTYTACLPNLGAGGVARFTAEFDLPDNITVGVIKAKYTYPIWQGTTNVSLSPAITPVITTGTAPDTKHYRIDIMDITEFGDFVDGNGLCNNKNICLVFDLTPQCGAADIPTFDIAWDFDLFCGERFSAVRSRAPGQYTIPISRAPKNSITSSLCNAWIAKFINGSGKTCTTGSLEYEYHIPSGASATLTGPSGSMALPTPGSGTIASLPAGDYTLTVDDGTGCSASRTLTIVTDAVTNVSATKTNVNCNSGIGGSISITATGGSTPYSYAWSNGATAKDIYGINAGSYTVTVTNAGSCTATLTETIAGNNALALTSVVTPVCGSGTGAIDVSASGSAPLTYSWFTSSSAYATTEDINGLSAGTYNLTVTDAVGCTATLTKVLVSNTVPTAAISAPVTTICQGNNATFTASGGGTYLWSKDGVSTSVTTAALSKLNAAVSDGGTYTVMVSNAAGCTATASKTLVVNAKPNAYIESSQPHLCYTQGGTTLTAYGGGTYNWGGSTTTQSIYVTTGYTKTYEVAVTNNGCSTYAYFTVEVKELPTVSISGNQNVCLGTGNTLSATGSNALGTSGGFTYEWNTIPVQSVNPIVLSPQSSTMYTVTATDVNGCTAVASKNLTVYPIPDAKITPPSKTICEGQTTILTASAGAGGGSIQWSGSPAINGFYKTVAAGTYSITVTNNGGCSAVATATVTENPNPVASITPSKTHICYFQGGGMILTANGGSTYSWGGTENGQTLSVNPSATKTYGVTVASNGCTATATYEVVVKNLPMVTIANDIPICRGSSKTLTATGNNANGTTGPFDYTWNTTPVQQVNPLVVSPTVNTVYTVTATDVNGCTVAASKTVTVNANPAAGITGVTSACSNVSITYTATGGGTYLWSTGATTASIPLGTLSIGDHTYTVTVTSGNGCTAEASKTISIIQAPTVSISGVAELCVGKTTTLTASPAETYTWNVGQPPTNTNTAVVTLGYGTSYTYRVTVTNPSLNSCTATAQHIILTNPTPSAITTVPEGICKGNTATLQASGGGTGADYTWFDASSVSIGSGATLDVSPLSITPYRVSVTSAKGCTNVSTNKWMSVVEPKIVDLFQQSCEQRIRYQFYPVPGTYVSAVWTGPTPIVTTSNYNTEPPAAGSSLLPGTYTLRVASTFTTTANCFVEQSVTIIPTVSANPVITYNGCTSSSSANITLNPAGGIAPYTYNWSPAATTMDRNSITPGNYTVTITDSKTPSPGCKKILTISVPSYTPLQVALSNIGSSCAGSTNAGITTTVTGGSTPNANTYLWSDGATTKDRTGLVAGTYTLTVTDGNGCTASATATISSTSAFISGTETICAGGSSTFTASGGTSYIWSNAATTSSINVTSAGIYYVTATDANGCSATAQRSLTVLSVPVVSVGASPATPACNGTNVTLTATGGGTYQWDDAAQSTTGEIIVPSGNHTYHVTVTGSNGCTTSQQVDVTSNDFSLGISPVVKCISTPYTPNSSEIQVTPVPLSPGLGATYTYSWQGPGSFSSTSDHITNIAYGDYYVTVTSSSGCSITKHIPIKELTVNLSSPSSGVAIFTVSGGNPYSPSENAYYDYYHYLSLVYGTGSTDPYTHEVYPSPARDVYEYANLLDGEYSINIKDALGCSANFSVTFVSNQPLISHGSGTDIIEKSSEISDSRKDQKLIPIPESEESVELGNAQVTYSIYPNPTSGRAYIACSVPLEQYCDVVLVNTMGQRVILSSQKFNAGVMELNTHDLAKGLYTVRVLSDGKLLYTTKLSLVR